MKASNSLTRGGNGGDDKKQFSAVITGAGAQKLIRASLRDERAAARFTGTLINVVKASEQLQNCDAGTVISCALRGEGMGLTYGHGYYVVPFKTSATFIVGFKGYIQLALATGLYADIDCIDVKESERKGRDPRTGKPIVDMSVYDTDEERDKHPTVGYKAYFLLKDGFYREEYWTIDELLKHADRYSKAFSLETYRKWQAGKTLTADEQRAVDNGPWYTSTDRMMRKTALRSLLNSGYAPLSNELKSLFDREPEGGDGVIPDLDLGMDATPSVTVDDTTGEVIDVTPPETPQDAPVAAAANDAGTDKPEAENPPERKKTASKRTTIRVIDPIEDEADSFDRDDYERSFFGEDG